eukprot:14298345-Ditylum_brightwellii.AAC.1
MKRRNSRVIKIPVTHGQNIINPTMEILYSLSIQDHTSCCIKNQAAFDVFVAKIVSYYCTRDIILWRTTVPGDPNFNDTSNQKKFNTFEEYFAMEVTEAYSLNQFIKYNDYVIKVFNKQKRQKLGPSQDRMGLLDVYSMMVQHLDGHVSN